jgi:hypothetical protein
MNPSSQKDLLLLDPMVQSAAAAGPCLCHEMGSEPSPLNSFPLSSFSFCARLLVFGALLLSLDPEELSSLLKYTAAVGMFLLIISICGYSVFISFCNSLQPLLNFVATLFFQGATN